MISVQLCHRLARYNRWQNQLLLERFALAEPAGLRRLLAGRCGVVLSEGLVSDLRWLRRVCSSGEALHPALAEGLAGLDFAAWRMRRQEADAWLVSWALALHDAETEGHLFWYSPVAGRVVRQPWGLCVTQIFLSGQQMRSAALAFGAGQGLWQGGALPGAWADFLALPDDMGRV